jgi:hypothetical protein
VQSYDIDPYSYDAEENELRFINGEEFSKMLLDVGFEVLIL